MEEKQQEERSERKREIGRGGRTEGKQEGKAERSWYSNIRQKDFKILKNHYYRLR